MERRRPGNRAAAFHLGRGDDTLSGFVTIADADQDVILALNNAHAVELSWLEPARLRHLITAAYYARMTPDRRAFLLAFTADADYDSPNFLWFRERHARFVYIDRVVVAAEARGHGLARALYADLFARAGSDRHSLACCEVNIDPPNPASDRFHAALGFTEAGRATTPACKTVRYLVNTLKPNVA